MDRIQLLKLKFKDGAEASLKIGADHSLFVGHKPNGVSCEEGLCENILSTKTEEDIVSFGLFGGSANNMNTFYPNMTAEDWTPKDEDFIQPVFRLLSETTVYFMGIPIDFSQDGVLKKSINKMLGQTVNTNHETEVQEAVGSVSKVFWQQAYKKDGVDVPAGMNGVFKIDAKSNPRLARGILMDPPSIHSNSVTVRFEHKKSHDIEDFWSKAGTYDDKGELIRLIATGVKGYKETSLVSHGADPYAQKVDDDGQIINPKYAVGVYDFSADNSEPIFKLNNNDKMELTQLLAKLGLENSGIKTWEELVAHFQKDPKVAPEVALYNALLEVQEDLTPESLTQLAENQLPEGAVLLEEGQSIITEDQAATLAAVEEAGDIATLVANAELGKKHLDTIRKNAIAHFKLLHGDAASEKIIETIENADLEAATAFASSYEAEVERSLPLHCNDCNSTSISRASSDKTGKTKSDSKDYQSDLAYFSRKSRTKPSDLHQKSN